MAYRLKSIMGKSQGRNSKKELEARIMKGHCLLVYFFQLAHLPFFFFFNTAQVYLPKDVQTTVDSDL